MAEVNPDVLAQMHRIHRAANDGTFDKDSINDALKLMHDFLSGAAYEAAAEPEAPEAEAEEGNDGPSADEDEADDHPHKRKPRKKR